MSILNIPLNKALRLFYADESMRRSKLLDDIRLDNKKEAGGNRTQGGDFFGPLWADTKKHISGEGDLHELTENRVQDSKYRARLYPLVRDGILDLLTSKLRWVNEPIEIIANSVSGSFNIDEIGTTVRVRDALHARVRERFTRVIYPYFNENPALNEEAGRLGLWAMQQALTELNSDDMRIIDPLRRVFYSPENNPLRGDEREIFIAKYKTLIKEWEDLKLEMLEKS